MYTRKAMSDREERQTWLQRWWAAPRPAQPEPTTTILFFFSFFSFDPPLECSGRASALQRNPLPYLGEKHPTVVVAAASVVVKVQQANDIVSIFRVQRLFEIGFLINYFRLAGSRISEPKTVTQSKMSKFLLFLNLTKKYLINSCFVLYSAPFFSLAETYHRRNRDSTLVLFFFFDKFIRLYLWPQERHMTWCSNTRSDFGKISLIFLLQFSEASSFFFFLAAKFSEVNIKLKIL